MTRRGMDKHTTYYEVLEAVRGARGCPLCRLEASSVHRYLNSLLYESVNDPGFRAELIDARGFCGPHTHELVGMRNALGIAILYRDQVKLFADFLDHLPAGPSRSTKREQEWQRVERCPACRAQLECRERYASTLAGGLGEEEMRAAFAGGSGLCAEHFLYVLAKTTEAEVWGFLVTEERRKVEALLADLGQFCRKHDYRFTAEGFGREGDSWRIAAELIAGLARVKRR